MERLARITVVFGDSPEVDCTLFSPPGSRPGCRGAGFARSVGLPAPAVLVSARGGRGLSRVGLGPALRLGLPSGGRRARRGAGGETCGGGHRPDSRRLARSAGCVSRAQEAPKEEALWESVATHLVCQGRKFEADPVRDLIDAFLSEAPLLSGDGI